MYQLKISSNDGFNMTLEIEAPDIDNDAINDAQKYTRAVVHLIDKIDIVGWEKHYGFQMPQEFFSEILYAVATQYAIGGMGMLPEGLTTKELLNQLISDLEQSNLLKEVIFDDDDE